jgi:hypothetical protein
MTATTYRAEPPGVTDLASIIFRHTIELNAAVMRMYATIPAMVRVRSVPSAAARIGEIVEGALAGPAVAVMGR